MSTPTPPAAPAENEDDTALTLNGVVFSKVQGRDRFLAYDKDGDELGSVWRAKGETRWSVKVADQSFALTFTSSVAARAFILGCFAEA